MLVFYFPERVDIIAKARMFFTNIVDMFVLLFYTSILRFDFQRGDCVLGYAFIQISDLSNIS